MRQITIDDIPRLWIPTYRTTGFHLFVKQCRESTNRKGALKFYAPICAANDCREIEWLTVDHVVPISVAYYLNWSIHQTVRLGNLQVLCKGHHIVKDNKVILRELKSFAFQYNLEHQNALSIPKQLDEEIVENLPRI